MKVKQFITKAALAMAVVSAIALIGATKRASAACMQYDPNSSISTPVFNNFCNVPNGVGNEPDFVRVRQSSNGNNEDNVNNPVYTVGTLNATCKDGDQFDVWTYVHNNAASGFNNNGAGSAVAKNVNLHLGVNGLNTTGTTFGFNSSVSASNAAGVQANATLACGNNVKLTLVPSSVHIYSQQYNWNNLPDSSINSTFKIGSPAINSGTLFGCWEYRVVVVYSVKVTKQVTPPPVTPAVCKLLTVTQDATDKRKVSVDVGFTAGDTTVSGIRIDYGDGTVTTYKTNQLPATHTYANDGNFTITATVVSSKGDVTSAACQKNVNINVPPVTPPVTPTTPTPTVLPNTGAGNVIGIFAGVSVLGAVLHRLYSLRKARV